MDGISNRDKTAEIINNILVAKRENEITNIVTEFKKIFSIEEIKPYAMLGWDQVKEMSRAGIHFGSHTKTHRNLCLLDDVELRHELIDSKAEIEEKLGVKVHEFTYPFGIFDERVKNFVQEAGFKCARTILKGINYKNRDRFLLTSIPGHLKKNHLIVSISFNSVIRSGKAG